MSAKGGTRMLRKKALFGSNIEPACSYCEKGTPSKDGQMILCRFHGVVAPYYACRQFIYCPFKRVPVRQRTLPHYDASEFEL